jgi:D-3-phosphoglycerate dehydrogenase
VRSAAGTLIGKSSSPRIVSINTRAVEVVATGKLLIIENSDEPGMIGYVGTLLGRDKVNIANMSLSRQEPGQTALMVINLDSEPSDAARRELKAHKAIRLAKFVHL